MTTTTARAADTVLPEGHESHEVMGIMLADGSFRPTYCNTCYCMWIYNTEGK